MKSLFVHEVRLSEKDEFSKRFNRVSDLYAIAVKEDTDKAWQDYFDAKLCLEQGHPMSFPNDEEIILTTKTEVIHKSDFTPRDKAVYNYAYEKGTEDKYFFKIWCIVLLIAFLVVIFFK